MIAQVIKTLLTGQTTNAYNAQYEIYNIVGENVFPNVVPQNYGTPAIVYTITDTETNEIKNFRTPATTIDIDIDILGDSYAIVTKLSTLIIANLHRYNNSYDSSFSRSRGFGIPTNNTSYGQYTPASTGVVQYIGGVGIIGVNFINSIEDFDEKLELYRTSVNIKLTYLEGVNMCGSILNFNFQDLNLMQSYSSPNYTQPVSINDNIYTLFSESIYPIRTISGSDTLYNFNQYFTSEPSDTPIIKQNSDGIKYLSFDTDKYMDSAPTGLEDNKYKKASFICVATLPDSKNATKEGAIVSSGSSDGGMFRITTDFSSGFLNSYKVFLQYKTTTGVGSYQIYTVSQWVAIGLNEDLDWSMVNYFAISIEQIDSNTFTIVKDFIFSSDLNLSSGATLNTSDYYPNVTTVITGVDLDSDGMFSFSRLHNETTNNDPIDLYELSFFKTNLNFGSTNYLQIKNYVLNKYKGLI